MLVFLLTQKSLRDEEMTSLTGVMKRINIISDLRARVKRACDCGFLHWHRVGKLSERAEDWLPFLNITFYYLQQRNSICWVRRSLKRFRPQ